jgi:hypothetical protein
LPVQAAVVAIAFVRHACVVASQTPTVHWMLELHEAPGPRMGEHVPEPVSQ